MHLHVGMVLIGSYPPDAPGVYLWITDPPNTVGGC